METFDRADFASDFGSVTIDRAIIAVENLNSIHNLYDADDLPEEKFDEGQIDSNFSLVLDDDIIMIKFMGNVLWDSDNDDRKNDSEDEDGETLYEALELTCLRKAKLFVEQMASFSKHFLEKCHEFEADFETTDDDESN